MFTLLQVDSTKELMLPDSLQKVQLSEAIEKVINLDISDMMNELARDAGWFLLKVAIALAIYYLGKLMIRFVIRIMDKSFAHHQVEESLRSFLRSLVKVLLLVMLVLAIIQTLGVNTSSFLAMFASAGLAIGMALSGTLQNFAGGVVILLLRPYKIGDYIEAQGQAGTVSSIGLFSTCIKTPDNQTIYIPNNAISSSIIDNYSQSETRRVDWTISISYGDDVDVARQAILAMLAEDSRVMTDPAPMVVVSKLNNSSIDLSIRVWSLNSDYWGLFFDMNERLYKELPTKGIHFPYPHLTVDIKK